MPETKKCRMCHGENIEKFLDLGNHTLMNSLVAKEDLDKPEEAFPLHVGFCHDCSLVQLMYIVDSTKIYQDVDYLFYSSDMPTLKEYFKELADEFEEKYLKEGDFVVEIAANDGVLIGQFSEGIKRLGVDPATNVVMRALRRGIPVINSFFNQRTANQVKNEFGTAKAIIGCNCIAHIDDLDSLMNGVKDLLAADGVFMLEANYWGGMVKNINYGLIYLDHFSFFSVGMWDTYAKRFGMRVFDAYVTPAQGGSLRAFLCKDDRPETERLKTLRKEEADTGLNTLEMCKKYAADVNARRDEIRDVLGKLRTEGKTIAGYGAAAKGLSILKSSNIGKESIHVFVDDSPAKQGFYTPETHIPVKKRSDIEDPDYFMILAPNYADVIMEKEKEFAARGGKFIVPKAEVKILPEN